MVNRSAGIIFNTRDINLSSLRRIAPANVADTQNALCNSVDNAAIK